VPVQQLLVGRGPLGDPVDPGAGQAVLNELLDRRLEDAVGRGPFGRGGIGDGGAPSVGKNTYGM
jgi:hypothetical protein